MSGKSKISMEGIEDALAHVDGDEAMAPPHIHDTTLEAYDRFLARKVSRARAQARKGMGIPNEEIEAKFSKLREMMMSQERKNR